MSERTTGMKTKPNTHVTGIPERIKKDLCRKNIERNNDQNSSCSLECINLGKYKFLSLILFYMYESKT